MMHHRALRKFGRVRKQRTALLRSLARALILHERITTTTAKAKELRPFVEELVTKAREDSVATRRLISARLGGDEEATKQLVEVVAPRYRERPGGYTRIVKMSGSRGRTAAVIAFV